MRTPVFTEAATNLPKGSYVVPFGVCYGCFGVRDYNVLPNKEQHRRVWVNPIHRPSYVVPFWVVYYNSLPKSHNRPKKELHRSPWVHLKRHVNPSTRQFDQEVLRLLVEARASVHKAWGRKGLEFFGFRALDGLGFRV